MLNFDNAKYCADRLLQKPKNWRLACQAVVGDPDSRGAVCFLKLQLCNIESENERGYILVSSVLFHNSSDQ